MDESDDLEILHYGTPRHSGRYPWGSGHDPLQRSRDFLGYVKELEDKGLSPVEVARGLGVSTTQLRAGKAIAKNELRKSQVAQALNLKEKGMSNPAIGRQMGLNESSVRALLNPALAEKQDVLTTTANMLKDRLGDGYLDIGSGTENHLGISATKLSTAVAILKEHGYQVINVQVGQATGSNKTTVKVLAPPGTTYGDVNRNKDKIQTLAAYSDDAGHTYEKIVAPQNISSDRIAVRYADEGGSKADGVIYVRPGVDDVSLGAARYAQVRIAVDGSHYLKGMAMYKDDLPPGVDLLFNTNKHNTGNKLDALKPQSDDEENPFGSSIKRQRKYIGADGQKHLSVMNIVNEEGDWQDWSRTLSSQFLSKQDPKLAKKQLDLAFNLRNEELDEIKSLTNPVVKRKLLETFADGTESAAVHLKAAALPSQGTHVILPFSSLKENEIYAPKYENGTRVALVRFPHAGTFEIPELVVNNKNREARDALGPSKGEPGPSDAVGIHHKTAERLSGADFDGDTVLVIPNNRGTVRSSSPLQGLRNFDPQIAYRIDREKDPHAPAKISARTKQQQMGNVSNLITDMSIRGATNDELARAVRHSMVVIDAEKHDLDYLRSYEENGIASLKEKYQGRGSTGRLAGASTIVSRSGNATVRVPEKRVRRAAEGGAINPVTGEKVFVKTGATRTVSTAIDHETGKRVTIRKGLNYDPATVRTKTEERTSVSKPLLEVENAHQLSSGTPIEHIYADHSNRLKALSNQARKEAVATRGIVMSQSAKETYAPQVARLNAALNLALKNRPLERQAQLISDAMVKARMADNPGMEADDLKKLRGQTIKIARERVGAKKPEIQISSEEWQAIQSGAISTKRLSDILDNADLDKVKELATPRSKLGLTPSKLAIAEAMVANGYTQVEIATHLGVSTSTLNKALTKKGA